MVITSVPNVSEFQAVVDSCRMNEGTLLEYSRKIMKSCDFNVNFHVKYEILHCVCYVNIHIK